ncbi:MAG: 30S ribosomal protein S4 [Candidatus Roizmanbacteria bacterium]
MRYTGPRNRLARREKTDLGLKTPGSKSHASMLKRINIDPGQHSTRGRRKVSEHGKQLREKQKLRYIFGVSEKQLKNYFIGAKKKPGNTGVFLAQFLESRLDNVIFRLGFAPTRAAARQLVSHNHIKVDGKVVNIASYQVRAGEIVNLKNEEDAKLPVVASSLARVDMLTPTWLERKGTVGKIITVPESESIEKQINMRLVIEFYSR